MPKLCSRLLFLRFSWQTALLVLSRCTHQRKTCFSSFPVLATLFQYANYATRRLRISRSFLFLRRLPCIALLSPRDTVPLPVSRWYSLSHLHRYVMCRDGPLSVSRTQFTVIFSAPFVLEFPRIMPLFLTLKTIHFFFFFPLSLRFVLFRTRFFTSSCISIWIC